MRRSLLGFLTIWSIVVLVVFQFNSFRVQAQLPPNLPAAKVHPLPAQLANWRDRNAVGDYFDQIKPLAVGYPIWSDFPLKVYVEPADTTTRSQRWVRSVGQAIREWAGYLPLQPIDDSQQADITFWRSALPIQFSPNRGPTRREERVRSAETRFEVFVTPANSAGLASLQHRAAIRIRPDQAEPYLVAAARHELGHALGIWGHSLLETDVMYYAQVRQPPPISVRDINTLKKVYEQPTQLGWPLPNGN